MRDTTGEAEVGGTRRLLVPHQNHQPCPHLQLPCSGIVDCRRTGCHPSRDLPHDALVLPVKDIRRTEGTTRVTVVV